MMLNVISSNDRKSNKELNTIEFQIEEQGIIYGWKSVGLSHKNAMSQLKQFNIAKYKSSKVARFASGNVLLCEKNGCFNSVEINQFLCKFHLTSKEKYFYCTSSEICTTRATYGYEEKRPLTCKKHITEGAFDVISLKCKAPNCKKQASFGNDGKSFFCLEHKDDGMKDSKHRKCIHPECSIRASFGESQGLPLYCFEHNELKYRNIVNKKCKEPGCEIEARFSHKGGKVEWCFTHKEDDMSNLYTKKCIIDGCEVCATFGEINGNPTHCGTHKEDNMKNLRSKKCIVDGCDTVPIFGVINGKNTHCFEHKDDSMVDNRNKKCIIEGCEIRSSYGYLYSDKSHHCFEHSTSNEYNQRKRHPRCSELSCLNDAKHINIDDEYMQPIHCLDHKQPTDIELIEKECKKCSIKVYIPDNKDLCAQCGDYRIKIIRVKEEEIKQFLLINKFEFINNKPVYGSGSLVRPDFLIDCKFGKIIIECDEFQHSSYDKNKEEKQMITIYKDIQFIKHNSEVLFIRYNPDNSKYLKFDTPTKLTCLYNTLLYLINLEKLNMPLAVIYLYYTGFNPDIPIPLLNIKI